MHLPYQTKMMQKWTKPAPDPVQVSVLIFDQFSNLCLANCLEPMRAANVVTRRRAFDWSILTPDGAPAASSSGMQVLPHAALGDMAACDYLFVHASYGHEALNTPALRRAIARAGRQAGTVVGLDTGPWLLAAAGMLEGRRATLHWDLLEPFAEAFLQVDVQRARVVRDGPVMTCAGAMSALDLMLGLIGDHLGTAARLDVEDHVMHGSRMAAPDLPGGTPLIRRALALMRAHVEQPLSLGALATRLSVQPRTLDRRFRAALGAPPGTVYRHLRLSEALKLLESTGLSISEIAVRCGYESPAALARAMRRRYGRAPSDLRNAFPGA